MTRLAPSWLLNAQATDAGEDAHLPPGVHLRVLPGFGLGLPVAPLLVWRWKSTATRASNTRTLSGPTRRGGSSNRRSPSPRPGR